MFARYIVLCEQIESHARDDLVIREHMCEAQLLL